MNDTVSSSIKEPNGRLGTALIISCVFWLSFVFFVAVEMQFVENIYMQLPKTNQDFIQFHECWDIFVSQTSVMMAFAVFMISWISIEIISRVWQPCPKQT